jgi:hypothetical protein
MKMIYRSLLAFSVAAVLAACGGGGGSTSASSTTAPTVSATLTSSSESAYQGDSVTLTWTSKNATSCTASGAWTETIGTSGSQTFPISILGISTFTLTCSSGSQAAQDQRSVTTTGKPNFLSSYNLPDFSNFVTGICSDSTNGSIGPNLGLVDLNNDGIKDIVTTYWCSHKPPGEIYDGPTPNTLIVFLSKTDGTYFIGNKKLFGIDRVDIGGFGRSMPIADFNNDGKLDVGIAISKEDSRAQDATGLAWNAPQIMLLSQSDGTYIVQKFLPTQAGGTAQAVENSVGGVDFVYPTYAGALATAFRWVKNAWEQISGYPAVNVAMNFFPEPSSKQGSQAVLTNSTNPADGTASLELKTLTNGNWVINSRYSYPGQIVKAISWNGEIIETQRSTINGVDMLYATFEDSCFLKLYPTSQSPIVLARMAGFLVPETWDKVSLIDERTTKTSAMLIPFDISNNVLKPFLENPIDSPPSGQDFTNYRCKDINGDGYDDLVINTSGAMYNGKLGYPIFYINNKNGRLIKTEVPGMPLPPQNQYGWPSSNSLFEDMNGDGFMDIIYYTPLTPQTSIGQLNYSLKIHYGTKNIGD